MPAELPPAEAAFGRACLALTSDLPDQWEHARGLFEEAVRASGREMLWRAADACAADDADLVQASFWMRRAVAAESDPDGITVDPGTLCVVVDGDHADHQRWEIAVASDDPARAVAALTAAEDRLMLVLEDGRELSEEEADDVLGETDLYSPNYAAVDDTVPRVWMDCKGAIMPLLARTALRIVAEELRTAGLPRAHLFTPPASPPTVGEGISAGSVGGDLVGLFDHVWGRFRGRMEGLGDEEWGWRPVGDGRVTLRWRLEHLAELLREERNAVWLGVEPAPGRAGAVVDAAGALAEVEAAYGVWRGWLAAVGDEELAEPVGAAAGVYGAATRRSFVLHIADEFVHHTAEAALLRDLYAGR